MSITTIIQRQRQFFNSETSKDLKFRIEKLRLLKKELLKRESEILKALHADFRKSEFEGIMTETGIVISEINKTLNKLKSWAKPKRVFPALLNFPSAAKIHKEPYGTVLIIAPWNYPYQLAFAPLIGAIAAGNTAVLKPSELTPHTSKICKEIIEAVFDKNHVAVIEGGVETSQELLAERWDYIFFTGSVQVGKIVAQAAAKHLTPTTLELGGKNPCIIDETASIKLAAKRMVWGKFINAGQTCIAPDYWLVHHRIKEEFITALKQELFEAYGENPKASSDYPRIVNTRNFDRLFTMLQNENIIVGGETDRDQCYIAPTLIDEPKLDSEVMKGEIFGPISPIISYTTEADIERIINQYEKPLALYVFSNRSQFIKKMVTKYAFGGGTINDTTVHFANDNLPFGGVGESGLGAYHGKRTFDTFSHHKGVVKRYNWLDVPIRYAPYKGKTQTLRTLLKLG